MEGTVKGMILDHLCQEQWGGTILPAPLFIYVLTIQSSYWVQE